MKYTLIALLGFGLLCLALSVPVNDEFVETTDDLQTESKTGATWGGRRRRWHWHHPHRHSPHRHNPHRHNPHKHNPHKHTPVDVDTAAYGGGGGHSVNVRCPTGSWIKGFGLRTGALVDQLEGVCTDGSKLSKCGGNGGGYRGVIADPDSRVAVRTGSLVDKFEGHGGNGGSAHILACGSGYRANGYHFRCGSLVDRVQFHCRLASELDKEKAAIDKAAADKKAKEEAARKEQERLEAERKARQEAERKAAEEAKKKAEEEAAAAKKAEEEAEAARKAEEERRAKEAAARKAEEEKKAKEAEEKLKAEEARIAAEAEKRLKEKNQGAEESVIVATVNEAKAVVTDADNEGAKLVDEGKIKIEDAMKVVIKCESDLEECIEKGGALNMRLATNCARELGCTMQDGFSAFKKMMLRQQQQQ